MENRYLKHVGIVLTLIFVVGTMMVSGTVLADSNVSVAVESGKNINVVKVTANIESDGLHIKGALQRKHFSTRRQLAGVVTVTVHNSEGKLLQEKTLMSSSLYVPKGIRQVGFSGVLAGSFPDGSTVTVSSVN